MLEAVYVFLDNHIILYLSTHLIALLYLLLLNRRAIAKHFTGIKKNTWIMLLIIFLLGFSLRNSEYWYGLNTDDYASIEGAKYLLVEGKYVRACAHGMLGECYAYHYALQPPGSSFLAALVYMAFGINSIPVLILFGILSSLTVIIVFLLCHLLFRNEYVGLYSSLIFSVIPLNIIFSGTGCERILSVFFISLAVLFYLIAIRNNDLKSWVLFALSLSFSIYMRQENYVLLLMFIAGFLLFRYDILRNLRKLLVAGAVFMLFQIHVMYWTVFSPVAQVIHPLGLPVMSHMCMIRAAPYIAWFLTGFVPFGKLMPYNYLASFFFFAGICISVYYVLSGKRSHYGLFFVFLWFLIFFMAYSSYCMNFMEGLSHDPDGSYMRYCIQFSVPYSILTGYAIYLLHGILRKRIPHKILKKRMPYKAISMAITILILAAIALISLLHTLPSGIFMDSRTMHDHGNFPAIMRIPQNSTIITSLWMLVASDVVDGERKVISLSTMVNKETPEHSIRLIHESSDVYYIKEPSCDTYPGVIYGCEFIRKNLNLSYSFSEGGTEVYRVIVEPDAEYNFVWDDAEYNVIVRSNRIISIEREISENGN